MRKQIIKQMVYGTVRCVWKRPQINLCRNNKKQIKNKLSNLFSKLEAGNCTSEINKEGSLIFYFTQVDNQFSLYRIFSILPNKMYQ